VRKVRDLTKPPLHFLHVSKAGGTAIRTVLHERSAKRFRLVRHPHNVTLNDIPIGEKVFLVVRDPATRFVSGFNSRLRRGGPHQLDWSAEEERAFARFSTPDDLARSLYSDDPETAAAARDAVGAVRYHLRRGQIFWVGDLETLRARRSDVLLVGRQWALDEDFARLAHLIGLSVDRLPTDQLAAHRTPGGFPTTLSDEGLTAVRRWYAADYELLDELVRLGPEVGFVGELPDSIRKALQRGTA
jgi:hypothetical protein